MTCQSGGFLARGPNNRIAGDPSHAITRPLNKAFEYPPHPGELGHASGAATYQYDANTKPTAVVFEGANAMKPITEFDNHAAFMALVADPANMAGLLDWVYRKHYPNSGHCPDDDDCGNVTIFQVAIFRFTLIAPTVVEIGDTVTWATDTNRGKVAPFHGEIQKDRSGFQITDMCCENACSPSTEVFARVDLRTPVNLPPAV